MSLMLNDPGLTHFAESSTISRPRRPLTDIRKQPTMYSRKTDVLGDSEQNKTRKCPIHYSNHSLNKGREFLSYQFETVRSSYVTTNNTAKDCQAAVRGEDCGSQCYATSLHMVERNQGQQVKSTTFKESSHVTPGKEHSGEPNQLCSQNFN